MLTDNFIQISFKKLFFWQPKIATTSPLTNPPCFWVCYSDNFSQIGYLFLWENNIFLMRSNRLSLHFKYNKQKKKWKHIIFQNINLEIVSALLGNVSCIYPSLAPTMGVSCTGLLSMFPPLVSVFCLFLSTCFVKWLVHF